MGGVQSKLKTFLLAIKLLLKLNEELQELLKRASAAPGLPVPNPTKPFWLEDPPFPDLVDIQSPELPAEADIVIIGSGITGAAVARTVLQQQESAQNLNGRHGSGSVIPRIVVLEARSLCSGATGRNGGHIKSSPHELFEHFREDFGLSSQHAAALTRFQLAHVHVLTQLCEAEGWDIAECRKVETTDMYLVESDRDRAFEKVRELRKWIPELDIEMWGEKEAQKIFEVNHYIKGAISYPAGALWPFRFVSCVWKDLLSNFEKKLSLETHTPVSSVETTTAAVAQSTGFAYEVGTPRGNIRCNHVVHATNGFATQFIPGLRGKMTGVVGHMSAQRPGNRFPDLDGSRSWSVIYGSAYDYVTQRPTKSPPPTSTTTGSATASAINTGPEGGEVMLGGGFSRSQGEGMSAIGSWDDSKMDALPISHLSGVFPTIFEPSWGDDAEGGRLKSAWSGVLGITGDFRPFVGRLDSKLTGRKRSTATTWTNRRGAAPRIERGGEKGRREEGEKEIMPGEWVSAGYCGDGMCWAWLSGTALGLMLTGREAADIAPGPGLPGGRLADWFPEDLRPTPERIKKADISNLLGALF